MKRLFTVRQLHRLALLSVVALLPMIAVAADGCDGAARQLASRYDLVAGAQQSLALSSPVTRLAVGDPTVADIAVMDSRTLLLQGKRSGATSLLIWDSCDRKPRQIRVVVEAERLATLQLAPRGSTVASQPAAQAALPSQVQADIRFVEVSRSRLRDVGTRLQLRSGSGRSNFFGSPGNTSTAVSAGLPVGQVGIPLDSSSFNIVWGGESSRFLSAINLLEQSGYAYTLSRPSLVAMSGQSANFLAGGEVPVPVPQGQNGTVAVEYKEFGVRLTISPTIVDANQILLKVAPEVSDLDFSNAVTIQGSVIPALSIRRTDTTISLADGESFIISGLVSRSTIGNLEKLPGLGSLPILGAFFRSTRFETDDRELLMIVTPRLVRPLRAQADLPTLPGERWRRYEPSTGSLFWQGLAPLFRDSAESGSR